MPITKASFGPPITYSGQTVQLPDGQQTKYQEKILTATFGVPVEFNVGGIDPKVKWSPTGLFQPGEQIYTRS